MSLGGSHHMGTVPSHGGFQHSGSVPMQGGMHHMGSGMLPGTTHHSGSVMPGQQLHHSGNSMMPGHHQPSGSQPGITGHHSGLSLGSRPGINNSTSGMLHHGQTGSLHHQQGMPGGGQPSTAAQHHTVARVPGGAPGTLGNAHHANNLQQARSDWSNQPHGTSARHANLANQLNSFHHGHHQMGTGNGSTWGTSGNWSHHGGTWGTGSGSWHHHQDWRVYHNRHYWPYYGWYGGFWNPGSRWYASYWGGYPLWGYYGLTPWGINRSAWMYGYWNYSNPYCYAAYGPAYGYSAPYNYALPIVASQPAYPIVSGGAAGVVPADELPAGVTAAGKAAFDAALAAFKAGDYATALGSADSAIQQMPTDAVAHEFRALTLFALGRYDEAAEATYAVLAVGPGWDWETMIGLYGDPEAYTAQLRNLEAYVGDHLNSSPARFLLAYHYMRCGHNAAAETQLQKVLELTPGQKVATDLLAMIQGPDAVKDLPGAARPIVPPAPRLDVPEIKSEQLVGKWSATGPDQAAFSLVLNADGSFLWKFTREGKTEEVKGVWAVDGAVLALEADAGPVMLADVVSKGDKEFVFRMTGAGPDDPGLDFQRAAP